MNTSDIQISQRKAGKRHRRTKIRKKQNHNNIINLCPVIAIIALDVSDLKNIPQIYYLTVLEMGSPKWVIWATIKEAVGQSCLLPVDTLEGNLILCLFPV